VERAPVAYQDTPEGRKPVRARYLRRGRHEIGFEIGPYDRGQILTIDPVLSYSTYLGGTAEVNARSPR